MYSVSLYVYSAVIRQGASLGTSFVESDPSAVISAMPGQSMAQESDGIVALMVDLEVALESCEGVEWADYGETKSLTVMALPEIGYNSLAARSPADLPFEGRFDYGRRIYVAKGDIFVEITIWETLEGAADTPVVSDDEMYRIASTAVSKLPN